MSLQFKTLEADRVQSRGSVATFTLLCACVASQGYALPILTVGPSWAVWPTPPIVVGSALVAVALLFRSAVWPSLRDVLRGHVLLLALCFISFGLVTVAGQDQLLPFAEVNLGFPLYQFWIMLLAGGALWAASTIHFDEKRITILRWVTFFTLLWVCITVCLTYQNFIPTQFFAPQIPTSKDVAGPYVSYLINWEGAGLGTISYNHAYPAALILILSAFWLQLVPKGQQVVLRALLMSLALLAIFLTGSRAGFAGFLLFLGLVVLWERSFKIVLGLLAFAPLLIAVLLATDVDVGKMIERQKALITPPSTETLAERDLIWSERLDFLNEDPVRWIIGTGFGSANASGDNAHMLYLHIIVEMGLLGLLAFGAFYLFILKMLWQRRAQTSYFLFLTCALFFAALTQETLYPVPALGFILPLYLIGLAIVVRSAEEQAVTRAVRTLLEDSSTDWEETEPGDQSDDTGLLPSTTSPLV